MTLKQGAASAILRMKDGECSWHRAIVFRVEDVAVEKLIAKILLSSETKRINFSFVGKDGSKVLIDGNHFAVVAAAIKDGTISVKDGAALPDGTARYESRGNVFRFAKNLETWSRAFNALVVHESVHAYFDLSAKTLAWIDNETAGYVAQGYYLRNSGFPPQRLNEDGHPFAAYKFAKANAAGDTHDADIWLDVLKKAIAADSNYSSYINGDFTGDGGCLPGSLAA
jgi:hypothetical protein